MMDRQRGDVIFECDGCGEVLDSETGNFEAAVNLLRRSGWKFFKEGDVWIHRCPDCKAIPGIDY